MMYRTPRRGPMSFPPEAVAAVASSSSSAAGTAPSSTDVLQSFRCLGARGGSPKTPSYTHRRAYPLCQPVTPEGRRPPSHPSYMYPSPSRPTPGGGTASCSAVAFSPGLRPARSYKRGRSPAQDRADANGAAFFASPAPPSPRPGGPAGGRSPPAQPASASATASTLRLKTELCAYYSSSTPCPYGSRCTYAHGPHELSTPKLMDLVRAGLVRDAASYRVRPCQAFVSTGACPFGHRCSDVHDIRVAGPCPAWMPHCEAPVRKLGTDVNIANLHHHAAASLHRGNPFGMEQRELDWADFYQQICSGAPGNGLLPPRNPGTADEDCFFPPTSMPSCGSSPSGPLLTERHAIEIVLKMRGGPSDPRHKFRPTHLIKGREMCMVLQDRAFRIDHITGDVLEVPLGFAMFENAMGSADAAAGSVSAASSSVLVVKEIAFGPDADPSVRGVALWFGIPENDIAPCSPKEIDLIRKKLNKEARKCRKKKEGQPQVEENDKGDVAELENVLPMPRRPFFLVRPTDEAAHRLSGSILAHRLNVLKLWDANKEHDADAAAGQRQRTNTNLARRTDAALQAEMLGLRSTFESLRLHWAKGAWPASVDRVAGEAGIDDSTVVPTVDGEYVPAHVDGLEENRVVRKTWEAFLGNVHGSWDDEVPVQGGKGGRLGVFEGLATGRSSNDGTLGPDHEGGGGKLPNLQPPSGGVDGSPSAQWAQLLLPMPQRAQLGTHAGWEEVRAYYLG